MLKKAYNFKVKTYFFHSFAFCWNWDFTWCLNSFKFGLPVILSLLLHFGPSDPHHLEVPVVFRIQHIFIIVFGSDLVLLRFLLLLHLLVQETSDHFLIFKLFVSKRRSLANARLSCEARAGWCFFYYFLVVSLILLYKVLSKMKNLNLLTFSPICLIIPTLNSCYFWAFCYCSLEISSKSFFTRTSCCSRATFWSFPLYLSSSSNLYKALSYAFFL